METVKLRIENMTSNHCVKYVQQKIEELTGTQIKNIEPRQAEVLYDPAQLNANLIVSTIKSNGYNASII